jgi:hypothetical protein
MIRRMSLLLATATSTPWHNCFSAVAGGLAFAGFRLIPAPGMGFGHCKLAASLGTPLGW